MRLIAIACVHAGHQKPQEVHIHILLNLSGTGRSQHKRSSAHDRHQFAVSDQKRCTSSGVPDCLETPDASCAAPATEDFSKPGCMVCWWYVGTSESPTVQVALSGRAWPRGWGPKGSRSRRLQMGLKCSCPQKTTQRRSTSSQSRLATCTSGCRRSWY